MLPQHPGGWIAMSQPLTISLQRKQRADSLPQIKVSEWCAGNSRIRRGS